MKRRCLFILLLSVLIMVVGCASSQDIAKKRSSGDVITASYEYPWEKVYDTYRYILENSAMDPIATRASSSVSHVKYLTKEKAILVMAYTITAKNVELAIYFTPDGDNKTKVAIVKGSSVLTSFNQDAAVKQIFDEVTFVLKNDGQGYNDYSTANAAKYEEELRSR
jgi:hypothetical protein